ncbi:hypothetical protein HAV1_gp02 [Hyperthermophilic Archaeal Virus 1]|uniref:hypothetical protein n=1 Tax=Hyperthermophilic Archaeal Virus 1 TaxID=762905 RepID=UPI0001DBADED|nr:hypothetical protein HAV1_gp02 [Hyperthermophilic Archaeal Virus 1]ADJ54225.1 hypothetical protein HAV1_gp02 [Hyperthermophilic Archaeal Virus 1]
MNTEQKKQMAESLEKITEMANMIASASQWEKVKEVAKDIIAWTRRDARRFSVEVDLAVGTRMVRVYMKGAERYIAYGEKVNDMSLRQLFEHFFEDSGALVNMIEKLAEAIIEVANTEIEKNSA